MHINLNKKSITIPKVPVAWQHLLLLLHLTSTSVSYWFCLMCLPSHFPWKLWLLSKNRYIGWSGLQEQNLVTIELMLYLVDLLKAF